MGEEESEEEDEQAFGISGRRLKTWLGGCHLM